MFRKCKYVRTKENRIILFSDILNHSDFKSFNPISAGFIDIFRGDDEINCECYGESFSLGIESLGEEDSDLAERQILLKY